MDPDLGTTIEEPGRKSMLVPILIALGVGLVLGVILGRMVQNSGDEIEVLSGRVGAISADLDSLALEDSDESFDLSHATLIDCGEGPEPGWDVNVGLARISTDDSDPPADAFLNTPEARIVLWVECLSN